MMCWRSGCMLAAFRASSAGWHPFLRINVGGTFAHSRALARLTTFAPQRYPFARHGHRLQKPLPRSFHLAGLLGCGNTAPCCSDGCARCHEGVGMSFGPGLSRLQVTKRAAGVAAHEHNRAPRAAVWAGRRGRHRGLLSVGGMADASIPTSAVGCVGGPWLATRQRRPRPARVVPFDGAGS